QEVCPWNRKAVLHHVEEFSPNEWLMRMSRDEWLALDEEAFQVRFKESPLQRPGLERIKHNL
ncbi:MAG: tRNA epoxyqueuosine(34) reductase QueG, partial [Butyricimonas faecihominis]